MQLIRDFVSRLETQIDLDENLVLRRGNRYFLLNEDLRKLVLPGFFYAGIYLGKAKNERFFPSFTMLSLIAEKEANKIIVDGRTEWLFICGRDIFKQGIVTVSGSRRKGDYTLILDEHGECLGLGLILRNLDKVKNGIAIKNISDIGDFLRREN